MKTGANVDLSGEDADGVEAFVRSSTAAWEAARVWLWVSSSALSFKAAAVETLGSAMSAVVCDIESGQTFSDPCRLDWGADCPREGVCRCCSLMFPDTGGRDINDLLTGIDSLA